MGAAIVGIGTADLLEAVNGVWDSSELNEKFKSLWPAGVATSEFPVLHDQEAGGEQPFPYCVLEVGAGRTFGRMSKGDGDLWAVRDIPLTFRIHASVVEGDARTGKQIAAWLAEEVMKVFGGHPTVAPRRILLSNGDHLVTLYQSDFPLREQDDRWLWTISYIFRVDVPEMA